MEPTLLEVEEGSVGGQTKSSIDMVLHVGRVRSVECVTRTVLLNLWIWNGFVCARELSRASFDNSCWLVASMLKSGTAERLLLVSNMVASAHRETKVGGI
jgi:hypothetical protein